MQEMWTDVAATPQRVVELFGSERNSQREIHAMEIPKDVQEGIERIYGEELWRRIAELDQRDAKLREDVDRDITETARRRCGN